MSTAYNIIIIYFLYAVYSLLHRRYFYRFIFKFAGLYDTMYMNTLNVKPQCAARCSGAAVSRDTECHKIQGGYEYGG